jgi:hypothetical protein
MNFVVGYFLGVTASTGDLSDVHEVLSLQIRGEVGGSVEQVPDTIKQEWAAIQRAMDAADAARTGGTHTAEETVEEAATADETGHHKHHDERRASATEGVSGVQAASPPHSEPRATESEQDHPGDIAETLGEFATL